jgi:CRISPR/Cas system CMR-associated protein Cmr3 (group 5 of RAMP superfamily)
MRNIYKILIIIHSFAACNEKVLELEKLSVSEDIKKAMKDSSRELGIVFYFDGECSLCYGNIMNINESFSDTFLILISETKDTALINYNLDKIENLNGELFIDSTSLFHKMNKKILKDNHLLLVNSNYDILEKSKFLMDNEVEEKFRNTIINYNKDQ